MVRECGDAEPAERALAQGCDAKSEGRESHKHGAIKNAGNGHCRNLQTGVGGQTCSTPSGAPSGCQGFDFCEFVQRQSVCETQN